MDEPDVQPAQYTRVRCVECGLEIEEDEAQAQRWGYWSDGLERYPFCPLCAKQEFGHMAHLRSR